MQLFTKLRSLFYTLTLIFIAAPVFAQSTGCTGVICNPLGSISDLPTLLAAILKFVATSIGPVIVTLMLVYCGFLFVVARGNEEKLREARTALLWTVIGAIILLGAAALASVIQTTVNGLGGGSTGS